MNKSDRGRVLKVVGKLEDIRQILEPIRDRTTEIFEPKSDSWKEGEKGEAMSEEIDALNEALDKVKELNEKLTELLEDLDLRAL